MQRRELDKYGNNSERLEVSAREAIFQSVHPKSFFIFSPSLTHMFYSIHYSSFSTVRLVTCSLSLLNFPLFGIWQKKYDYNVDRVQIIGTPSSGMNF